MWGNTIRKLQKGECFIDGTELPSTPPVDDAARKPARGGNKKRKAAEPAVSDEEPVGEDTPVKKATAKRAGKPKVKKEKVFSPVPEIEAKVKVEAEAEDVKVKGEAEEDSGVEDPAMKTRIDQIWAEFTAVNAGEV
jgi:hypothetical protein